MAFPRKLQINLSDTPYYHCIGRCVRQAFLYGDDFATQRNYDHRKGWVVEQLQALCANFSIRVCAYAVMSNHYHLVLRVVPEEVKKWSDEEVIMRYKRINLLRRHGTLESKKAEDNLDLSEFSTDQINFYREKLIDISSFMGALNEYLARRANKEDERSGRFWEARFQSMALLDDAALLTCMAYVDLNPIRAGIADSLENSDFTSIQERLFSQASLPKNNPGLKNQLGIFSSGDSEPSEPQSDIPCSWENYQQLVQWTGEQIRDGKKGYIKPEISSLLDSLSIHPQSWLINTKNLEKRYSWAVGSFEQLKKMLQKKGLHWVRGMKRAIQVQPVDKNAVLNL